MNNFLCSILLFSVSVIIRIDAQCDYTYTNDRYISPSSFEPSIGDLDQSECDQRCNNNSRCTIALLTPSPFNRCYLYEAPLIFISQDTDLTQCAETCTSMNQCVLLNHWGRNVQRCYIYNDTLDNFPSGYYFNVRAGDTIAEKVCP
ncbi:hypothetical protein LOTGIDRAFT_175162 [Lottia gigantea]|uniref:Apple domain-containing protein n=1 Tax=Lottia gigantea TaxID=225164 RepID=V3ZVK4_LOTGI|nr:hypothetical protein LOTGIDRAFT_175162 [Lottia gigantea]ESO95543.1 hypothetical protein LOTGIDRAFT_175162 [Lottia gigantea]